MPRKGQFKATNAAEVQGNNGGSYVRIEQHEKDGQNDGRCYLEVGHECVRRVCQEIEVTKLAQIIADALNP